MDVTYEKPTGLECAGFTNEIQPLPKPGDTLPKGLTRQYLLRTPSPYIFGTDPIPASTGILAAYSGRSTAALRRRPRSPVSTAIPANS